MTRFLWTLCIVATLAGLSTRPTYADDPKTFSLVANGKANEELIDASAWKQKDGWIEGTGANNYLSATVGIGSGYFRVDARLRLINQRRSAAHFLLGDGCFGFDGSGGEVFLSRSLFGGLKLLMPSEEAFPAEAWIDFTAERKDGRIRFSIN